jgi:hypothetical protein
MNRKIIIRSDDFNKEIFFFLKEVGADMPIDWDNEAINRVRNAVIGAYEKMGVTIEIDERLQSPLSKGGLRAECITEKIPLRLK